MKDDALFNLNILMVGTRATGKTTYLTCTYGISNKSHLLDESWRGVIKFELDKSVTDRDKKKLDGWWRDMQVGRLKMPATQEFFSYNFLMKYRDKSLSGDVSALPLLKLTWTDARGGDYTSLASEENGKKKLCTVESIVDNVNKNKCNAIMVFLKYNHLLDIREANEDDVNRITRPECIEIIKSIIEIKNSVNVNLSIVFIFTHCAQELEGIKKPSKADKENANYNVSKIRSEVCNVLNEIANDYDLPNFPIKYYFIDSLVSAQSRKLQNYIGLDDICLPMVSILGQCKYVIDDIIEQERIEPYARGIGGRLAKFNESARDFMFRSKADRLVGAFKLAADIAHID